MPVPIDKKKKFRSQQEAAKASPTGRTTQVGTDFIAREDFLNNANAQTRTFSRPTGTPESRNVETTNLPPQQANQVKQQNAVEGQQIAANQQQLMQQQANANIAQPTLAQNAPIVAGIGQLTPEQQAQQIGSEPGVATTASILAGGVAGAVPGAALGAAIGAPTVIGAPIGAAVGGGLGFIGGALTKISADRRQNVKEASSTFTASKSNMAWIINNANAGKISPVQAVQLYDEELANVNAAERHLKEETSTDLNRFLSGGGDELAKVDAFKRRLPIVEQQLAQAISMPSPGMVVSFDDPSDLAVQ